VTARIWIGRPFTWLRRKIGAALEINASPSRLDIDDIHARHAAGLGIPLVINTDAHAPDQLDLMPFGVSVARRAWLRPQSVVNTWEPEHLLRWLKRAG
jgi:DNA polymerase (family X)